MYKKLFVIVLAVCVTALYAETVSISWESWEPYQYVDSNRQLTGIDIEIITAVMKKAGLEYEFKEMPWKRTLEEIKGGTLQVALGSSKTAEREEYALFSDTYRTESANLFIRKGEASKYRLKTLADLKNGGFDLGVTRGYWYGDTYDALSKDPAFMKYIFEVASDDVNFRKLLGNRIDGFLADQYAGPSGLRKQNSLQYVEVLPVPVYTDDIFLMFSKISVSNETAGKIDAALLALKKDGTIQKILDKYLK